eukprot:429265_1
MAASFDVDNTPNGKINNLQVACISIECRCGGCDYSKGDTLYICTHSNCNEYFYCNDCGPIMHALKAMKDHTFDINSDTVLSINDIMDEKENTNKSQYGQKQLTSLIGVERYNKIAPYLKSISLVGSNVPMTVMLMHELTDFYQSVSKAVDAATAVQKVFNVSKKAETASALYSQLKILGSSSADILGSGVEEWKMASCALANQLNTANKLQQSTAVAATNALNNTMSIKDVTKAGSTGMLISTAMELTVHSFRLINNEISCKEWFRLTGKTISRNTVSLIGTAIGGKLGAIAGCHIGVTTATISAGFGKAIGGSVGIVSGMICGYVLGKTAEWIYEKYLPPNEQHAKKKLVQEALIYFHFQEKDIKNKNVFNKRSLRKRFRQIALEAHPDRNIGDRTEWDRLSIYYGVLKALLQQNDESKDIVKGAVMSLN